MSVVDEEWSAQNCYVQSGRCRASFVERDVDGRKSIAPDAITRDVQRARLAALAPRMARLLLTFFEDYASDIGGANAQELESLYVELKRLDT
jgi:hypothetical protein